MRLKRKEKEKILKNASVFNNNPFGCIPILQELDALPRNVEAKDMAHFLFHNPAIDKEVLGEYLGKNKEFNI